MFGKKYTFEDLKRIIIELLSKDGEKSEFNGKILTLKYLMIKIVPCLAGTLYIDNRFYDTNLKVRIIRTNNRFSMRIYKEPYNLQLVYDIRLGINLIESGPKLQILYPANHVDYVIVTLSD